MKKHASWQLPRGVSRGTWDYSETPDIATTYDSYFGNHGMFRMDESLVLQLASTGDSVIDLGCGTGRAIMPLLQQGFDCVACDLSNSMLGEVFRKAHETSENPTLVCARANLVDLDCFADASFDLALCLFSTLGMIRGDDARNDVLRHIARITKPGGLFLFQVHNYWVHLFDPEGPWWMLRNAARSMVDSDVEIGDRFYPYRGIPDMYLHSFSSRKLRKMLNQVGMTIEQWIPLNAQQDAPLRWPHLLSSLRASGWMIVARRGAD